MTLAGSARLPFEECPSFQRCSAPLCPLDPQVELRVYRPGEPTCRAERPTREAIAARYPGVLPWRGLLPKERKRDAGKARWAALPEDDPRKVRLCSARAKWMAQRTAS